MASVVVAAVLTAAKFGGPLVAGALAYHALSSKPFEVELVVVLGSVDRSLLRVLALVQSRYTLVDVLRAAEAITGYPRGSMRVAKPGVKCVGTLADGDTFSHDECRQTLKSAGYAAAKPAALVPVIVVVVDVAAAASPLSSTSDGDTSGAIHTLFVTAFSSTLDSSRQSKPEASTSPSASHKNTLTTTKLYVNVATTTPEDFVKVVSIVTRTPLVNVHFVPPAVLEAIQQGTSLGSSLSTTTSFSHAPTLPETYSDGRPLEEQLRTAAKLIDVWPAVQQWGLRLGVLNRPPPPDMLAELKAADSRSPSRSPSQSPAPAGTMAESR
jgi:hypothetical protein